MNPAPPAGYVRLTSTTDGREHRISDARYACAVTAGDRELVAACGQRVVMAALATLPGVPCGVCADAEASSPTGLVRRVFGRFGSSRHRAT